MPLNTIQAQMVEEFCMDRIVPCIQRCFFIVDRACEAEYDFDDNLLYDE